MSKNVKVQSGISGYLYNATSITILFTGNTAYRYDISTVLTKDKLTEMIKLAKSGSGLTRFLNANPDIKKYGYVDNTLHTSSFKKY